MGNNMEDTDYHLVSPGQTTLHGERLDKHFQRMVLWWLPIPSSWMSMTRHQQGKMSLALNTKGSWTVLKQKTFIIVTSSPFLFSLKRQPPAQWEKGRTQRVKSADFQWSRIHQCPESWTSVRLWCDLGSWGIVAKPLSSQCAHMSTCHTALLAGIIY